MVSDLSVSSATTWTTFCVPSSLFKCSSLSSNYRSSGRSSFWRERKITKSKLKRRRYTSWSCSRIFKSCSSEPPSSYHRSTGCNTYLICCLYDKFWCFMTSFSYLSYELIEVKYIFLYFFRALILLLLFYGLAGLAFVYFLSFMFKNPTAGYVLCLFFLIVSGRCHYFNFNFVTYMNMYPYMNRILPSKRSPLE